MRAARPLLLSPLAIAALLAACASPPRPSRR
jgi:hypothetical protein